MNGTIAFRTVPSKAARRAPGGVACLCAQGGSVASPAAHRAWHRGARGEGANACRHDLFTRVAAIHNDPLLEPLAVRALEESDPQVAQDAARYLSRYGSAAAELPLWRRYEAWNRQWAGRAAELRFAAAGPLSPKVWQANLGQALAVALATGRGWLADPAKIDAIAALGVVEPIRGQAAGWLAYWKAPRPFVVSLCGTDFLVAQYRLDSLGDLEAKLSQFPPGTEFEWGQCGAKVTPEQQRAFQALSAWARERGIPLARANTGAADK